jgi:hypothetical protein
VLFLRLPASGHFASDLLPGFLLVAIALGLAFVGDFIASTAGTSPNDAGLASGLINTSQQIGGAIGLAVTTTVAATRTAAPAANRPSARRGADQRVPRRIRRHRRPRDRRCPGGGHPYTPNPAGRRDATFRFADFF